VNRVTHEYHRRGQLPVVFGPRGAAGGIPELFQGEFAIGRCVFSGPGLGLVSTFPMEKSQRFDREAGEGGSLGLLVAGTDAHGLRDALAMGQPTIPPMVRAPYTNMQPDFVVTGPDFAWKVSIHIVYWKVRDRCRAWQVRGYLSHSLWCV